MTDSGMNRRTAALNLQERVSPEGVEMDSAVERGDEKQNYCSKIRHLTEKSLEDYYI